MIPDLFFAVTFLHAFIGLIQKTAGDENKFILVQNSIFCLSDYNPQDASCG